MNVRDNETMNVLGSENEISAHLLPTYASWLEGHARRSRGDARDRLRRHGHAEKMFLNRVWWPAFGTLEGLHPEYEVRDFKDGVRYLDYAYLTRGLKLGIEIDGYGTHWRDIDRHKFGDHLLRQNHLVIDGWLVLRFSYDHVKEKPRMCQQMLQQLLGKTSVEASATLSPLEKAIVDLARRQTEPLRTKRIAEEFMVHRQTALRHVRSLVAKNVLMPLHPESKHVRGYVLTRAEGTNT